MKTVIRITAAAGLALGAVVVATPAQAAPHPSPSAYTHANGHAKFKRTPPPLTRQFCGPLPANWPSWAPPLTPCKKHH